MTNSISFVSVVEAGVSRELLPEKKLLGSRDPSFIMKRRRDLESYLLSVFNFLQCSIPVALSEFLLFNRYDINFLLNEMAAKRYDAEAEAGGDPNINEAEVKWTPLELFAISSRLKSPLPPQDLDSKRTDFTNVADQACQVRVYSILRNAHY